MKRAMRWTWAVIIGAGLVAAGWSAAWADDGEVYDWPSSDAPVLVANDSGVILIGKNAEPMRAFSWNGNDGDHDQALRLTDMSGDGTPQIVGSGTPSFVLSSSGEPTFSFQDGCRQVVIADIVQGTTRDFVCVESQKISVYTDRGRFAWSIEPGRNIDWCRGGDLTGDTRDDLECKIRGAEQYLRLGSEGSVLASSAETANLEGATESLDSPTPSTEDFWTEAGTYDLDGDGEKNATVVIEDNTLIIRVPGEEGDEELIRQTLRGTPQGAVLKDLDGEGGQELVLLTDSRIYIVTDGGQSVADFGANAGRYSRVPFADLHSVYANGFGEANDDAREAVKGVQDEMAQCYGTRLRQAPYVGSGRLIMQAIVNEDGSVETVQKRHSGVGDDQVEDCAADSLRGVSFPSTEEGQASVNVNVIFTFRDNEG